MSTIDSRIGNSQKEAGMVAIMVTLILMIVISLIVLGFAQISRRNQREALDHQLSTQAFYAAESGVNDATNLIKSELAAGRNIPAKPDCTSNGNGLYAPPNLNPDLDDTADVKYSCLTIDPEPTILDYKSIGTNSTVVPLKATSGNINSVTLTWETLDSNQENPTPADGCRPDLTKPLLTTQAWDDSNCGYGVLRFDLVPTASGLTMANLLSGTITSFVVPLRPGANAAATDNPISYASPPGGGKNLLGVVCSDTGCSLAINGLTQNSYYMRVSSLYKDVSLKIAVYGAGNVPLKMQGAQAIIDVTGKAQDVLRRIQVRVPLTASSTNLLSDYAVQSTDAICKRFSVMQNYFRNDADNVLSSLGVTIPTANPMCQPGPND